MSSPRSKEDWKALIEPHLSESLRTVSETITRTRSVQNWLHDASMEVAEGLGHLSGPQGEMQGYMRMRNALTDRFPSLIEAVEELTEGCGHVDLHWRPLDPNYSRLYIDFATDFSVKVFCRLSAPSPEAARDTLDTVAKSLPEGSPFPNRPNTVTGLLAFRGNCLGLRVKEHLSDNQQQRYRSVTLLPPDQDPIENLSVEETPRRIVQILSQEDASPDWS